MSFDIDGTIQVVRERRGVVLKIPGKRQKNRRRQLIPTTPAFVAILEEHPTQTGYVFNPAKRDAKVCRVSADQAKRVISMIGAAAGVVVNEGGKSASAHDLRRSFGQRLADAGVAVRDLQKIMRHANFTTTEQYYLRDDAISIGDRIAGKLLGEVYPENQGTVDSGSRFRKPR